MTAFLNPASTQPLVTDGLSAATWSSIAMPTALSCTLAATTITAMSRPRTSVAMPRLRPRLFLSRMQPRCLLGRVDRGVHGLGVHHDRGRILAPPAALAHLPAQQVVDHLIGAVVAPLAEVVVHGGVRREVVREAAPLAAHPGLIQDRVDDLPHLVPALVPADRAVLSLP